MSSPAKAPVVVRGWWASFTYGLWAAATVAAVCGAVAAAALPALIAVVVTVLAALTAGVVIGRRLRVEVQPDEVVVMNPLRTYRLPRRQLRVETDCVSSLAGGGRPTPMVVLSHPARMMAVRALATVRIGERALADVAAVVRTSAPRTTAKEGRPEK